MILLSLNKKIFLFFVIFFFSTTLFSEDSVDIWKIKNTNKKNSSNKIENPILKKKETNIDINSKFKNKIEISSDNLVTNINSIYGIYDPSENNLTLEMWSNSEGTRIKDTIDRINKIKLSSFAEELFVNTLFTVSKLPGQNMTEEEFIKYKIDWLIENKKDKMISVFLNKNKTFPNKNRILKYLVDQNIAKGDLKAACEQIDLIDNDIKDSYLDQFKVICLINEKKKMKRRC